MKIYVLALVLVATCNAAVAAKQFAEQVPSMFRNGHKWVLRNNGYAPRYNTQGGYYQPTANRYYGQRNPFLNGQIGTQSQYGNRAGVQVPTYNQVYQPQYQQVGVHQPSTKQAQVQRPTYNQVYQREYQHVGVHQPSIKQAQVQRPTYNEVYQQTYEPVNVQQPFVKQPRVQVPTYNRGDQQTYQTVGVPQQYVKQVGVQYPTYNQAYQQTYDPALLQQQLAKQAVVQIPTAPQVYQQTYNQARTTVPTYNQARTAVPTYNQAYRPTYEQVIVDPKQDDFTPTDYSSQEVQVPYDYLVLQPPYERSGTERYLQKREIDSAAIHKIKNRHVFNGKVVRVIIPRRNR